MNSGLPSLASLKRQEQDLKRGLWWIHARLVSRNTATPLRDGQRFYYDLWTSMNGEDFVEKQVDWEAMVAAEELAKKKEAEEKLALETGHESVSVGVANTAGQSSGDMNAELPGSTAARPLYANVVDMLRRPPIMLLELLFLMQDLGAIFQDRTR